MTDLASEIKKRIDLLSLAKEYGIELKRHGKVYQGLCPFHSESHPSFTIYPNTNSCYCFGCGKGGTIFDFVMLKESVDFKQALEILAKKAGLPADVSKSNKVVGIYNYLDAEGELSFQLIRYHQKVFKFKKPNGKGGWNWNLDGVKLIPYNLPNIVKAERVIIVEGEKDAETLNQLGYTATTNPFGAGKWRDEYSSHFRDKEVIIIPDNDKIGKEHSNQVAHSLLNIAKNIKIVDLPSLSESEDITDWLEKVGNKEELQDLIEKAPLFKIRNKLITVEELLNRESDEKIGWLIGGLIPENSMVMLSGAPGHFKTWFGLFLAKAVSSGTQFLGRETKKVPVIYVDRENPRNLLRARLFKLNRCSPGDLKFWLRECDPPYLKRNGEYLKLAIQNPGSLLIFDSFRRFHQADENDSKEMARTMGPLIELVKQGATVLFLHHRGKSEINQYRGSSDILAVVDIAFTLEKVKREFGQRNLLKFECIKNRFIEDFSLLLEVKEMDDFLYLEDITQAEKEKIKQEKEKKIREGMMSIQNAIISLMEEEGEAPNQKQIIQKVIEENAELGVRKIRELLNQGEGKLWLKNRGARNQHLYYPHPKSSGFQNFKNI